MLTLITKITQGALVLSEYRSQMEHPPEIEGSSIYRVPFVRVPCPSEPVESSSTEPNCKRRKVVG